MTKVKFGVFLPFYAIKNQNQPEKLIDSLKSIVLQCEELGYDSVWLDDHLMYGKTPILECWTTLSALTSITRKIRLGTMVTSNAFRNPALLAKMAATVDVLSRGRLEFGIGSGVQKEEHLAYGYKFPDSKTRIENMQETIEILKEMWTQEKTNYIGKTNKIFDAMCEPKPIQKPHPPITVGGCGEKYTLKVTAKFANSFDFGFLPDIEQFKNKMKILENYCQMFGRDFSEIEKSTWISGQIFIKQSSDEIQQTIERFKPENSSKEEFLNYSFIDSPETCLMKIRAYVDLGVTNFMLFFGDLPELDSLCLFAKAVACRVS